MFKIIKIIKSKTGVIHFTRRLIFSLPKRNINLYLHKIEKADEDKHEHDHPWDFYSFVLKGGYIEQADGKENVRKAGSLAFRKATDTHKILKLLKNPTYTLVLTCGEFRPWGYQTEKGWLHHVVYRTKKRSGDL